MAKTGRKPLADAVRTSGRTFVRARRGRYINGLVGRRGEALSSPKPARKRVQERQLLYLTRKIGESIVINDEIEVTVVAIRGKSVKLGFTFPEGASVLRRELFERIQDEKAQATAAGQPLDSVRLPGHQEGHHGPRAGGRPTAPARDDEDPAEGERKVSVARAGS